MTETMYYNRITNGLVLGVLLLAGPTLFGADGLMKPVTPNASPEAVELLKFIYNISGKHTLTGQHNFPNTKDASTQTAIHIYGKVPAIFGQDFGFAKPGDKDGDANVRSVWLCSRNDAMRLTTSTVNSRGAEGLAPSISSINSSIKYHPNFAQ